MTDQETLDNNFVYHAPKGDQTDRYATIRGHTKTVAELLLTLCPPSRERSIALTRLEEAVFWANASIARNE